LLDIYFQVPNFLSREVFQGPMLWSIFVLIFTNFLRRSIQEEEEDQFSKKNLHFSLKVRLCCTVWHYVICKQHCVEKRQIFSEKKKIYYHNIGPKFPALVTLPVSGLPDFYWDNIPKRWKIYQIIIKYTK
jgi:hypothetical protein